MSNSTFADNLGAGVAFQNYGNFSGNTFSSSGAQTVGIDGFLAGTATLVGNSGTALADLQGSGVLFVTDNTGQVVSGPQRAQRAGRRHGPCHRRDRGRGAAHPCGDHGRHDGGQADSTGTASSRAHCGPRSPAAWPPI